MNIDKNKWLLWLITFTIGLLWLTACAEAKTVEPKPTLIQPTLTATEVPPTPTFTPTPTRTPAPTARPLTKHQEEAGRYQNDLIGITLEYPSTWTATSLDEMDTYQVTITHPDNEIAMHMLSSPSETDEDLESYFDLFTSTLVEYLGFETFDWITNSEEFPMGEGVDAMQAIGSGAAPEQETDFYLEIIGAQRGSRIFWITIFALGETLDEHGPDLENFRNSVQIYSPRPYGVDRENALFFASGEPETLDPAKWEGSPGGIVGDLFSGLVQLDTNLQPIPDLADHWQVSPDGKVYTFYLREDVTFHNGNPFTAQDVVFSWNRACNPKTESNTAATYLGDIVGVSEVIAGEASEIRGLRVLDDHTIEVTLDAPKAYFLSKLSYPTSWIVDQYTVGEIEDQPNGTGPFRLVKHDENEVIILARNHNYHRNFVAVEYIIYLIYPGYSIRLYEAGEIDYTGIDEDLQDRANDPSDPLYGTVFAETSLCTTYIILDVSRPPFDDILVRKAFTLAIDKVRYNDVVHEGKSVVAEGLFPPGLPGYNQDVKSLGHDPAGALEALEASSYGGSAGLPEIVLSTSGAGIELSASDALLIQMWEEALDVAITVEQIDFDSYTDQLYAGEHGQIATFGWCADYPDPENFADILFHTGSKQNISKFSNPEVDELLEQARIERDVETRLTLYQHIEQGIVDDFPAIFISHSRVHYSVLKPFVRGYISTPIGVAQSMNLWIEREE